MIGDLVVNLSVGWLIFVDSWEVVDVVVVVGVVVGGFELGEVIDYGFMY